MIKEHPKYQIPDTPHGKVRYASAKRHAEAAKKAGKSIQEVHAVFKKIMAHDPSDINSIPQDAAHAKYRSAAIHAKKAKEKGKSLKEVHDIFRAIMSGNSQGHKK